MRETRRACFALALGTLLALPLSGQLDETCMVSALNRTAPVQPNGVWVLPNVPSNQGPIRARATCISEGITRSGQSDFFTVPANGVIQVAEILFGQPEPVPLKLTLTAPATELGAAGQTVQLTATATYSDASTADVSGTAGGTSYRSSNPAIASVDAEGAVTAVASGRALVSAVNEGTLAVLEIRVALSGDSDGDGLLDDFELANGLDPNNPVDALDDPDQDGLSTAEEFALGLDPSNPDGDGDGLRDGEEVRTTGTNPALFDTDGDQFSDGLEVATGSNPLDPGSFNLAATLAELEVSPDFFILTYNLVLPEASVQLTVTGTLLDGTRIDLTSGARGTTYSSSDLTVCNFGTKSGEVFAGQTGTCFVRAAVAGRQAEAEIRVDAFAPTGLSALYLPGHANAVDVQGDFAYVAGGAAGLVVVDVANRRQPVIAAIHDTPGNANDVKLSGSLALVSDGSAGLVIVDVSNPRQPVRRAVFDTPGNARDVAVQGSVAFVADGSGDLRLVNLANPQSPLPLSSLALPGEATGVEVDAQGRAVVASGAAGIHVVEVTNLAAPRLLGSLVTADARDAVLVPGFAFVADAVNGFLSVDLADPAHPVLRSTVPRTTGGMLFDVALAGRFATGADFFFYNGVPILDVSNPATPLPRAILDFRDLTSTDHIGFGVAADRYYIYRAGGYGPDNDSSGVAALYIGQYLAIEDTDQDGLPDDYERANGLDPQNPNDADEDPDGDGLTNLDEFLAGTAPRQADTDGDGLNDWIELYVRNTDPLRADTDGDGLNDSGEFDRGTDPHKPDTDGDGLTDGYEVLNGSDPLLTDTDADGLADGAEAARGTNPANPDTDGDGARDGYEVALACDPLRPDLTEVTGRVLRSAGVPMAGATSGVLGQPGQTTLSGADGRFSLAGILACPPATRGVASAQDGSLRLRGLSATVNAVLGGITNVGDILLSVLRRPLYPQPLTFAGFTPIDAVAGDFNRDGVVDMAVADRDSDRVRVLIGNGDGSFQPEVEYRVGPDPMSLAVADFDRDGTQDLVSANSGHFSNDTVSVLRGVGNGTFRTETRFTVGSGASSVAAADLGNDGIPDIVTADAFNNTISVLTGRGDGTFLPRTTLSPGGSPRILAVADLLRDGVPDILSLIGHNVAVIFRSSGGDQVRSFPTGGNSPIDLAVGDFNRDGRPDVATANYGTSDASVLLADGSGGFLPALRLPLGRKPWDVAVGDVDSDGDDDLLATVSDVGSIVGDTTGDLLVFPSQGDGSFQSARAFRAGLLPEAVVLADLESDGVLDAGVVDFSGRELFVLLGEGDGTFWAPRPAAAGDQPETAAVADFNGDGTPDLAVTNVLSGDVSILLRQADGTLLPQQRVGAAPFPSSVTAPDINGDGVPDLALTNDLGSLHWRIGQGDGTFQAVRSLVVGGAPEEVAAGDLDRDGREDLATANLQSDDVAVFFGNADGSLRTGPRLPAGDAPIRIGIFDLDGDGRLDLVAVNRLSNDLSVRMGNGDGTFGAQQRLAVGPAPSWVAAGDLDHNGALDLVAGGDYTLSILMGRGGGAFDAERRLSYGELPQSGAVADADGDGIPDLFVGSGVGFSVLSGRGDGTFLAPKAFSAGGLLQALEDLDGDSQPDAVIVNDRRDEVIVLMHRR